MEALEVLTNNSLRAFAVFARHRNFTTAANELHLAQPSLHTKINKLGTELGVELYEKRGRTLRLTDAGELLARFANESEAQAEAFLRYLRDQPARISLFAGRAMLRWVLDEQISNAITHGVEVDVAEANREEALGALADGRADVVGLAADAPPPALSYETVAKVDQMLLVPTQHPLAKQSSVSIADLVDTPLVLPSAGRPHRQRIEAAFAQHQHVPVVAAEVDGWELMSHMASLGLGAAIVNGLMPAPKTMTRVKVNDLPAVEYWLVWRPERADAAHHLGCET